MLTMPDLDLLVSVHRGMSQAHPEPPHVNVDLASAAAIGVAAAMTAIFRGQHCAPCGCAPLGHSGTGVSERPLWLFCTGSSNLMGLTASSSLVLV